MKVCKCRSTSRSRHGKGRAAHPQLSCQTKHPLRWAHLLYMRGAVAFMECSLHHSSRTRKEQLHRSSHCCMYACQMPTLLQVLAEQRQVGLLICTHRCSDVVVFRCLEAGLALVAGVDREEAHALCRCAASICMCRCCL